MTLRSSGGRDRKLKWPLRWKVVFLVAVSPVSTSLGVCRSRALYSGMVRSAGPDPGI